MSYGVVGDRAETLATPNAEIKTLITVTKNIPIIVKLLILFAIHICFSSFTLYRAFHMSPTPTATCNSKSIINSFKQSYNSWQLTWRIKLRETITKLG